MTKATLTITDTEGNEMRIPARWFVCTACDGEGVSSAYLGAFSREYLDADPEFAELYLAGFYDRPCERCKGQRLTAEPDWRVMTEEQCAAYREHAADEAHYRAMCESERRMGA